MGGFGNPALERACPTCGVGAGRRCRDAAGEFLPRQHLSRLTPSKPRGRVA